MRLKFFRHKKFFHAYSYCVLRVYCNMLCNMCVRVCVAGVSAAIQCSVCDLAHDGESCVTHPPAPTPCWFDYMDCITVMKYDSSGQSVCWSTHCTARFFIYMGSLRLSLRPVSLYRCEMVHFYCWARGCREVQTQLSSKRY